MADNELDQLDEILAFQSIYGDDGSFDSNTEERPMRGTIKVDVDFGDEEQHEFLCNGMPIFLKYVSPLVMNFSLPSGYPSSEPPNITFECIWLTPQQLKRLPEILKDKWEECGKGVVLFEWVCLLKAELLQLLDLKLPLTVSENQIMAMTEHDILREEEAFRKGIHTCPVCFLERPGVECVRISSCGHVFCRECLGDFVSIHVRDGSVNMLQCLENDCNGMIYPNIIKSLVSDDLYMRYERIQFQKSLAIMRDVDYCPRTSCGKPVIIEAEDTLGYCHSCTFAFCTKCKQTYHGVEKCRSKWKLTTELDPDGEMRERYWCIPEDDLNHIIEVCREGSEEQRREVESRFGVDKVKFIMEDLKAEDWIEKNTKRCPGCWSQIEKNSGCNKMTCSFCSIYFCWLCESFLDFRNPYKHFNNPDSPCNSLLFGDGEGIVEAL